MTETLPYKVQKLIYFDDTYAWCDIRSANTQNWANELLTECKKLQPNEKYRLVIRENGKDIVI